MMHRLRHFLRGFLSDWRLRHRMGGIVKRRRSMYVIGALVVLAHGYVLSHVAWLVLVEPHKSLSVQPHPPHFMKRANIVDRNGVLLAADVIDDAGARRRVYPQSSLFSHVVGYTDQAALGLEGIEYARNHRLLRNLRQPLRLTVDRTMQYIVHEELSKGLAHWNAQGAAAVLLDVHNGHVRALVSLPDFDPHNKGEMTHAVQFNRVTRVLYEMGSVFKLFVAVMVLKSGGDENSRFSTSDLRVGGRVISSVVPFAGDAHGHSLRAIVAYSLNVGASRAALQLGRSHQQSLLDDFAMLTPVPIELNGAATPLKPSVWNSLSTATIAYGYGLSVTPLHMAAAVAAMVNGGFYHIPTLLHDEPNRTHFRLMTEKQSVQMRRLMRSAVTHGTGRAAAIDEVAIGGKTGTAHKITPHGYDENRMITSFVAAFPIDAPRYVLMVLLDEPQSSQRQKKVSGGTVAAPIATRMMRRIHQLKEKHHAHHEAF